MKAESTTTRTSVCPYNCWPINCGIAVVTGENGGIKEIRGNEHHDFNRGMLCVKGQSCGEIHFSEQRISTPLRRSGPRGAGKWHPVSWDEALDEIASVMGRNIKAGTPQRNAIYHSHGNIVQRINWRVLTPRFANMTGMTLWDGNFPCWYDVGVAQEITGFWGLHDPVEMGSHANAVINWAQDACASMANMVPYLIQARDRGATMITIDPRVTQTAAISDVHIRPRLGSDVWLANAVANILISSGSIDENFIANHTFGYERYKEHVLTFEPAKAARECEITPGEIELLAGHYAETKPLCTNLTRGALGKHWNGVPMVRSILCLIALSGNVGVKGGGAIWGESVEWNNELQAVERRPENIDYRANNFNDIDAALEQGEIDLFMVVGGNPLSQWPNLPRLRRQLKDVELVVVNDLFLNHTAREAGDIVLPGTSWLEELGLRTSNTHVYIMDKIAEPLGQCREASQWMNQLAKRVGVNDYFPWNSKEECLDDCLKSPECMGAAVKDLQADPRGFKANLPEVPYADARFSSPSGKFEFFSQKGEELGLDPLPVHKEPVEGVRSTPERARRYPLLLVSARRNTHFHSFHDSHRAVPTLKKLEPEPLLWVHPGDAHARGIKDGGLAWLYNDRGEGQVRVEVTTEVSRGHVSLNDCWPELNEVTPDKCPVPASVTKAIGVGGQPSYQNTLVELSRERP